MRLKALLPHEVLNCQFSLNLVFFSIESDPPANSHLAELSSFVRHLPESSLLNSLSHHSFNLVQKVKSHCQHIIRRWPLRQEGALGSCPRDLLTYVWYLCFQGAQGNPRVASKNKQRVISIIQQAKSKQTHLFLMQVVAIRDSRGIISSGVQGKALPASPLKMESRRRNSPLGGWAKL